MKNNVMEQIEAVTGRPTRVLLYDIENTSIQIEAWRTYQADAIRVTREWYILSIAYKWLGEKQTHVMTLADFPSFSKNHRDDKAMLNEFFPIFNSADIVIAHNGNYHDQRKLSARLVYHGLGPPSPYQQIDTYLLAKRRFAFTSNRLDALAEFFGVEGKKDCPPDIWQRCMEGDPKAFKVMGRYNKHDVVILEQVYNKLKAWQPNHPYIGVSGPRRKRFSAMEGLSCPRCGSEKLSSKGWKETVASYYRYYQCLDCGGYAQSNQRQAKKGRNLKSI